MSTNLIADLEEFTREMAKHDERQVIKSEPEIPSPEILELRINLIKEEVQETIEAMLKLEGTYRAVFEPERSKQMLELMSQVADGIADSIVVLIGTALAYGIPLQKVWDEVHRSNMDKVTKLTVCPICDGHGVLKKQNCVGCNDTGQVREPITPNKRSDGKILKPEGWQPPNIKKIIEDAINRDYTEDEHDNRGDGANVP